jgi:hypothetical protein
VDFNTDYQSERELPREIQRLVLDEKSQPTPTHHEHKKLKKKQKHREDEAHHRKKHSVKTPKTHRYPSTEVVHSSIPPPEFLFPSFQTVEFPFQPNSTPFWYFPM